jgi:beta-phosphoglucomutase-like phosphatase (HAD superfamily)
VSGIVRVGLGADVAAVMRVFAGDVVPKKKPHPAIYLLAAAELGVEPARCVVIEDSNIGSRAAAAAGMRCVVTTSGCGVSTRTCAFTIHPC